MQTARTSLARLVCGGLSRAEKSKNERGQMRSASYTPARVLRLGGVGSGPERWGRRLEAPCLTVQPGAMTRQAQASTCKHEARCSSASSMGSSFYLTGVHKSRRAVITICTLSSHLTPPLLLSHSTGHAVAVVYVPVGHVLSPVHWRRLVKRLKSGPEIHIEQNRLLLLLLLRWMFLILLLL